MLEQSSPRGEASPDATPRRVAESKPRREPYRPSSSASAPTRSQTAAYIDPGSSSGPAPHTEGESTRGSPPTRPSSTLAGTEAVPRLELSSLHTDAPQRKPVEHARAKSDMSIFISTADASPADNAAATVERKAAGPLSFESPRSSPPAALAATMPLSARVAPVISTPGRPSLPDALIQQIRNTPFTAHPSKVPATGAQPLASSASSQQQQPQPQHRRTLSYSATLSVPTADATRTPQLPARASPVSAAPCTPTPVSNGVSASDNDLRDSGYATRFALSISSLNGTSLCSTMPGDVALRDVMATAPSLPSSITREQRLAASLAHVLQRDCLRKLLMRVWLRWTMSVRKANSQQQLKQQQQQQGGRQCERVAQPDSSANALPPWRPLTGGGIRANSPGEHRIVSPHASRRRSTDAAEAAREETERRAIDGESPRSAAAALHSRSTDSTSTPPLPSAAAAAAAPTALAMEGSGDASHSTSASLTPRQQPQQQPASRVSAHYPSRSTQREGSPSLLAANHRSDSPHLPQAPPPAAVSATEARKKSVVSQYLAGKPIGNLSPQQSSVSLLAAAAAAGGGGGGGGGSCGSSSCSNGVVDVHPLALPGSFPYASSTHSRSQSGASASASQRRSYHANAASRLAASTTDVTAAGVTHAGSGIAGGVSDSEEQSNSSLYFTPRSRQSGGAAGNYTAFDDDGCMSNSSVSVVPLGHAHPSSSAAVAGLSLPQLMIREAEHRSALQTTEYRRRQRIQQELGAVMDRLMMRALQHRASERGLHPSLRASATQSPAPTSRSSSEAGDSREDSVMRSCNTADNLQPAFSGSGVTGQRSSDARSVERSALRMTNSDPHGGMGHGGYAQHHRHRAVRSPAASSSRSSLSRGLSPTSLANGSCTALPPPPPLPAVVVESGKGGVSDALEGSASARTRPRLSSAANASSVSRRLLQEAGPGTAFSSRGSAAPHSPDHASDHDEAECEVNSLSDISGYGHCGEQPLLRGYGLRSPLHNVGSSHHYSGGGNGGRVGGAAHGRLGREVEEDDEDTATAVSECTVQGLASTRQWVSQQVPDGAVAAAAAAVAAAVAAESASAELSFSSLSLSYPH